MKSKNSFDVIVIGGGPAGLISAIGAATAGAQVVLIEKNNSAGKKLLLTGNGRCNLTQINLNLSNLKQNYGENGKFLFSAFANFGVNQIMDFFESRGLKLKVEEAGKVFPITDNAQDVLDILIECLKENKVTFFPESTVTEIENSDNHIQYIKIKEEKLKAQHYIIATGGKSYATTGSNGDGFHWAEKLGHHIIPPSGALVPIKTKTSLAKNLQGLTLEEIKISVFQSGQKQFSTFGNLLFTHFGLSGPAILNMSKKIGSLLSSGEVSIFVDLKPQIDAIALEKQIQNSFSLCPNKDIGNFLPEILQQRLAYALLHSIKIKPDRKINGITKEERKSLVQAIKGFEIKIDSLMDFDSAMITAGGVDLKEIYSSTMQSKIIDNLFFAGEVLDLDGPTGGYNLQICWSTGFLAGQSAAKKLKTK